MGFISWLRLKFRKTPSSREGPYNSTGRFHFRDSEIATNETIFAAISILGNALASAPITAQKNYKTLKPQENSIAELLKYGPNNFQTTFEFIKLMETLRNRFGVAYAIKEYDSYTHDVSALYVLDSESVEPELESESKELYYRVATGDGNIYIHSEHIIAVRHITTDGYTPISPINVLRNTIDYDREIREFSLSQMQDGLNCKVAVALDTSLDPKNYETYDFFMKAFRRNGILYLGKGQQAQALNTGSIIDPKLFEAEEITVQKVARVYGIPPSKLLCTKGESNSNDQEDLLYLKDTILPIARMYEQAFTKALFNEQERNNGHEIKISLNGFARASMQARGEFYFKGLRSGWFTVDDIRELEDLAPFNEEWSKIPFISRDLIPLNKMDEYLQSLSNTTQKGEEEKNGRE